MNPPNIADVFRCQTDTALHHTSSFTPMIGALRVHTRPYPHLNRHPTAVENQNRVTTGVAIHMISGRSCRRLPAVSELRKKGAFSHLQPPPRSWFLPELRPADFEGRDGDATTSRIQQNLVRATSLRSHCHRKQVMTKQSCSRRPLVRT